MPKSARILLNPCYDWEMVKEKNWANTEDDFDRKRRKQAEFLVKNEVPVEAIEAILVFDEESLTFAQQILADSPQTSNGA